MNAREARKTALENQLGTKAALEQIKYAAERGETSMVFNGNPLSEEAALDLMKNYEYKIGKHTDPIMGNVSYKIEWQQINTKYYSK